MKDSLLRDPTPRSPPRSFLRRKENETNGSISPKRFVPIDRYDNLIRVKNGMVQGIFPPQHIPAIKRTILPEEAWNLSSVFVPDGRTLDDMSGTSVFSDVGFTSLRCHSTTTNVDKVSSSLTPIPVAGPLWCTASRAFGRYLQAESTTLRRRERTRRRTIDTYRHICETTGLLNRSDSEIVARSMASIVRIVVNKSKSSRCRRTKLRSYDAERYAATCLREGLNLSDALVVGDVVATLVQSACQLSRRRRRAYCLARAKQFGPLAEDAKECCTVALWTVDMVARFGRVRSDRSRRGMRRRVMRRLHANLEDSFETATLTAYNHIPATGWHCEVVRRQSGLTAQRRLDVRRDISCARVVVVRKVVRSHIFRDTFVRVTGVLFLSYGSQITKSSRRFCISGACSGA